MADIAQNLRELKEITALLAQNAIGQSARATHPAALSRLAPPDDYVPPLSTADSAARRPRGALERALRSGRRVRPP